MVNEVYSKVIGAYEFSVEADERGIIVKVDGVDLAWIGIDNSGLRHDVPMIAVYSEKADDHVAWVAYEPDGIKITYTTSIWLRNPERSVGAFYENLKEAS